MNKIEISCFDKRLDFLIDFTKTYKKGTIITVEQDSRSLLPHKQVLDFPQIVPPSYKVPRLNLASFSPQALHWSLKTPKLTKRKKNINKGEKKDNTPDSCILKGKK